MTVHTNNSMDEGIYTLVYTTSDPIGNTLQTTFQVHVQCNIVKRDQISDKL